MSWAIFLLLAASAVALLKNRRLITHYLIGAFCALPLVLIDPLLRAGFFEQLSLSQLTNYFINQVLLTASFGGLAAILYELLCAPKFYLPKAATRQHLGLFLIGFLLALSLFLGSSLGLVVCVLLGLLVNLIILLVWRRDLFVDALFSAVGTALLYALVFPMLSASSGQVQSLWFGPGLSGLTVYGLPIEELLVVALFGAFFGPVYIAAKSYYRQ